MIFQYPVKPSQMVQAGDRLGYMVERDTGRGTLSSSGGSVNRYVHLNLKGHDKLRVGQVYQFGFQVIPSDVAMAAVVKIGKVLKIVLTWNCIKREM